ncbi:MAPEG family protein [Shewanella sp. WXL01]|uniref:MAPEG family protein n=1 Tax=Shewanella sp. WXL01 TaxID=2709721 RepID=UPI001438430E|nr:MAPEG family protein [Shewanella sp. WXL01]NKF49938.1 MAPEG family protein [Shewanella sp. WXL01]
MTTILVCLLIAMILPYLAKAPVAKAMADLQGYDNEHPRLQQAKLTGFGARALAAHENAFESLILFAIACLVVLATDKVNDTAATLAVVHIVARCVYHIFYLAGKGTLRSLSWFVAIGSAIGIFCQAF